MLKKLVLGVAGVGGGDTAPIFGSKINHMVEELYGREGVDLQTNELPSARPISTGGTGATSQKSAAKNILPAASARQTIRYNGTDWVSEDEVTQIALATDWDTLVNAGVYYAPFVLGDGVNSPPDIWAYGFLRVTRSGNWIMQEVIGDDSRKSTRFSVDGGVTWKVWSDESTKADTAEALHTPRKITLAKGATGEVGFDGSGDVIIDVTLDSLGKVSVYKEADADKLEYLELMTDGAIGSTIATKAKTGGTVRHLYLGTGLISHLQLDPDGTLRVNPSKIEPFTTEVFGNFGGGGKHNLALKALGTGLSQRVGVAFYPTFGTGIDYEPRRAATISAGYNNGWGSEYLDIHVGGSTESQNVPKRSMAFTADGVVTIGDGGTSSSKLYIQNSGNGIEWNQRELVVENTTQDGAAIAFHTPARSSAGLIKWYGVTSQFECRNSNDTGFTPLLAQSFNQTSDYRLKTITGNVVSSGAFIDALKPRVGTWKEDGSAFVGFVAHEVQEVSPSSVTGVKDKVDDNGNPVLQGVAYSSSEIMANIVAELQNLRTRVAVLEASREA